MQTLEDRIVKLEEVVAYQQHLLQQIDKVLLETRTALDAFRRESAAQGQRIAWLLENGESTAGPYDEKPPHY